MHPTTGIQVIAQGGLAHLREIQAQLARRAIESEVVQPPKGQCGS